MKGSTSTSSLAWRNIKKYITIILTVVLSVSELTLPQSADHGPGQSPALYTIDPVTPEGLQELLKRTNNPLPLVSAHRGGAGKGFPENCVATFEHTLKHTYAMMEIDPRYTKDGAIVLHHDPRLERTTNGKGRVADFTLQKLKQLQLRDPEGTLTAHSMPTLDEALIWARGKTILVLDQKDVPVKARVRKVEAHRAEAYAILIVYSFEDAKLCYALNKNIMMEVMIPNREKLRAFGKTGVPWQNIVAFVGHSSSRNSELYNMIHTEGASCMAGSSRNIDRQHIDRHVTDIKELAQNYRALLDKGVDLIETDLPREVGQLLYGGQPIPLTQARFFHGADP